MAFEIIKLTYLLTYLLTYMMCVFQVPRTASTRWTGWWCRRQWRWFGQPICWRRRRSVQLGVDAICSSSACITFARFTLS